MIGCAFLFPIRSHAKPKKSTRQYTRVIQERTTAFGLVAGGYGTHINAERPNKIRRETGNLRVLLPVLGRTRVDRTARHLGVELGHAPSITGPVGI